MKKFINAEQAGERLTLQGHEYVVVRNPSYVFPAEEFCPLAPKITEPVDRLIAVVQDMDGTTTTTETLCLHSLETMVRRITDRPDLADWSGLDSEKDYPHIIGNSTTRHVEYLVKTYSDHIKTDAVAKALLRAAVWTIMEGVDKARRDEVRATLEALGWNSCLALDKDWRTLIDENTYDPAVVDSVTDSLADKYRAQFVVNGFDETVRAAIDIYYYRYHEILKGIADGAGDRLSQELTAGQPLIEPLPGVAVFFALLKGWLGEDAAVFYDSLRESLPEDVNLPPPELGKERLALLGRYFEKNPAKVAIVTSSIEYEAGIVLGEVAKIMRQQISNWPVRSQLADRIDDIGDCLDAVITASDSSEIRLKPHRDLYSIALRTLGIAPADFDAVLGLEDSESGTIAIRSAGVGLCVAVPFADTAGHDLGAAAHVIRNGLPQVILEKNLFLDNLTVN